MIISELSGKYQFGPIHTADNADGKVTNRFPFRRIRDIQLINLYQPSIVSKRVCDSVSKNNLFFNAFILLYIYYDQCEKSNNFPQLVLSTYTSIYIIRSSNDNTLS